MSADQPPRVETFEGIVPGGKLRLTVRTNEDGTRSRTAAYRGWWWMKWSTPVRLFGRRFR